MRLTSPGRLKLLLSAVLALFSVAVPAGERPNVLLIIADDLNGYGFNGDYPAALTPALDHLRQRSVVFDNAYAAAPLGEPSRAAFFSGLYPHRTGAYRNGANAWARSLANVESLPERFRRNGYRVFGAGRLMDGREREAWGRENGGGDFGPFPAREDLLANHGDRFWGVTPWTGPDSDFPDTVNTDAVIGFIGREHDKPFFLALGLFRPHPPFTAPARFFEQYDPASLELPSGYREGDRYDLPPAAHRMSSARSSRWLNSGKSQKPEWKRILHGYLAATSFADWNVGRVLEALESSPHAGDTIVVFWADNGFHVGEKNHFGKGTPWRLSVRTPAAVSLPGNVHNGRVVRQPVSAVDFFATLVDYCGLEPAGEAGDGLSLRPLLEKPDMRWERPAISVFGVNRFSATDGRHHYIRYSDGGEELYDLRKDPYEFTNLAGKPDSRYVIGRFLRWMPEEYAPDLGGRDG